MLINPKRRGTVFVVDDDHAVRDSLRALLVAAGFETRVFASGGDFLREPRDDSSQCLVLDIRLPGGDGFEVLRQIRQGENPVPTIMITGHRHLASRARSMRVGALAVLEKPTRDDELLRLVENAFDMSTRQSEA